MLKKDYYNVFVGRLSLDSSRIVYIPKTNLSNITNYFTFTLADTTGIYANVTQNFTVYAKNIETKQPIRKFEKTITIESKRCMEKLMVKVYENQLNKSVDKVNVSVTIVGVKMYSVTDILGNAIFISEKLFANADVEIEINDKGFNKF